jgi:pimeloyl-ACP methyl ester carboxylesterase
MKRFTIDLDMGDLRERLHRTRWPDHATFGGGMPFEEMREIVRYWADDFDWPREQARLNEFEHFIAEDIHFIRARGERGAIPLLLLHGWPGSFVEFLDVIPLLAGPFDLVIPSLPGFGFSSKPKAAGRSTRQMAALFVSLMQQLGFSRFFVQGGDFGAGIATWMAVDHPDHLLGIHLNYIPGSYLPPPGPPLTPDEAKFQRDDARWLDESGAYSHVQRTRPLTLGYALNDSPAGLAAWLVEKFREWADPASELPLDRILTNVTIYWLTETILSSLRLYGEAAKTRLALTERLRVPTAIARFPLEEPFPPREWIERGYDVRRYTEMPVGGHFAAMEQPALLAGDITASASALFRAPSAESHRA